MAKASFMRNALKNVLKSAGLYGLLYRLKYKPPDWRQYCWYLCYRITGNKKHVPIPPLKLLRLVVFPPEVSWYLISGEMAYQCIRRIMPRFDISLPPGSRILDFGCGVGRILWYWRGQGFELHGTDCNVEVVEWAKRAMGDSAEFRVNQLSPPLTYRDNFFDFIYANSVFTHLPAEMQKDWMAELRRVLRPGGHVYFTVMGESRLYMLSDEEATAFRSGQLVVTHSELAGKNECGAFHPQSYVVSCMADGFDVVGFVPNGARQSDQDVYIFRKKPS